MAPTSAAETSLTHLQEEHVHYCFETLINHLERKKSSADPPFDGQGKEFPLFVTWNITPAGKKSYRLRGCIGTFQAQPLTEGLAEYAVTSAVHDHRFNPIKRDEVPRLECGVSLLTDFEECDDYLDWEIGLHGIYIFFDPATATSSGAQANGSAAANGSARTSSGSSRSRSVLTATYLPDVIPDQGWTKVEAIDSAMRKAGWNGRITEDMRRSLRVRRYRSEKLARTYDEFVAWREASGRT